jgi:hypothetical protein
MAISERSIHRVARRTELRRHRRAAAQALHDALVTSPSQDEHLTALYACKDALHDLLFVTLSPKQKAQLLEKWPVLSQPLLFSLPRSSSE